VVGGTVGRYHPVGDVGLAEALYLAAGAYPGAVGVDEQGEHHLWVIGSSAQAVIWVPGMRHRGVETGHHVEHEPSEVAFWQPFAHVNWQQEKLVPVSLR
jgi:hypothetical protein